MTKFLTTFALLAPLSLAVAVPAIAKDAPATRTFTRDGQTYIYTATEKGEATMLNGRAYPSNTTFQLTVRGNRVTGRSGGVPVSFVAESLPIVASAAAAAR